MVVAVFRRALRTPFGFTVAKMAKLFSITRSWLRMMCGSHP